MLIIIFIILMSYLLGSIPFSYMVPKYLGKIDIRHHGSGNTGTTNVVRTLGLKLGAIAFVGDFLKGIIPALVGILLLGQVGGLIGGGFAVLGHCYPVWLNFKGGKGIATSAGILLIIVPKVFLALLFIQFFIIFTTKYMSLASISSAVLLPILSLIFGYSASTIYFSVGLGLFVIYRHRSNLARLIKGEEKKLSIGKK